MQRKRNIRLIVIFSVLLIWTFIFVSLNDKDDKIAVNDTLFSIRDTASINQIRIIASDNEITLKKTKTDWVVNDKYDLDPSMKKVILAVLHEVRVKRSVPKNKLDQVRNDLLEDGYKVIINQFDKPERTFYAGGNGISVSYFMYPGEEPYIVYLPGYESYVTGIFEVNENDWRDRLIYQTSWLGLKNLSLTYPEHPSDNVVIKSDDNLFRVENISDLDTATMMDYIDQVSYIYADQYVSHGQISQYDSLIKTQHDVLLRVDATGFEEPVEIKFFPSLPGEKVQLGIINEEQMCLFNQNRIHTIFRIREDFKRNPS